MENRLVVEIDDRNVVWQGFASCTSFKLLIEDKLHLFQQYANDSKNSFKCSLIALEINNLYVIFNEQIVSWIIAIENWSKNKNKTLLWNLCNIKTREISVFTKKLSDNYTEITDHFLAPYTFNLGVNEKAKIQNELRHCFHCLYSICLFGSSPNSKEAVRAFRQLHDKTKHGYVLFDFKQLDSLCVPDGKYSDEIDIVNSNVSKIKPVVLISKLNDIKILYQYASLAVPFFQFIICSYSINRFGETKNITQEVLNQVRGIMKISFRQFIGETSKLSKESPSQYIEQFVSDFEDCSLPKYQWTHEAHFYVGTLYLLKYGKEKALEKIRENIKNYNVSKGVQNTETDGYHETITRFYLWAIEKFILNGVKEFTLEVLDKLAKSEIVKKDFPYKYYSKELLFSKEARFGWVEPDIKPLE